MAVTVQQLRVYSHYPHDVDEPLLAMHLGYGLGDVQWAVGGQVAPEGGEALWDEAVILAASIRLYPSVWPQHGGGEMIPLSVSDSPYALSELRRRYRDIVERLRTMAGDPGPPVDDDLPGGITVGDLYLGAV